MTTRIVTVTQRTARKKVLAVIGEDYGVTRALIERRRLDKSFATQCITDKSTYIEIVRQFFEVLGNAGATLALAGVFSRALLHTLEKLPSTMSARNRLPWIRPTRGTRGG